MGKISAVYKITNSVTGDFYIGSSKNVKHRWARHKCLSDWKAQPNNKMYQDMQKYGVDKFRFQILAPVMEEYLKQVEQEFIELLKPTYNQMYPKGWDVERRNNAWEIYYHSDKYKIKKDKYCQSEKGKETHRKYVNKYYSRLCEYNGETLTLGALAKRFRRAGIEHPLLEAKKYLAK